MKNRFLIIFVSAFLGAVLLLGGIFGVIALVKNASSVARYDAISVDEGCVRYLASYYKMIYVRALRSGGVAATDTEAFWGAISEDGQSYGDGFRTSFREYLSGLLSANAVYDEYVTDTSMAEGVALATAEEILDYKANGSVSEFNSKCKKYGFDYKDFKAALELLYKAQIAKEAIYGNAGSNLASFPDECKKYLDTYSHVSLLFIRDETLLAKDEEGNYVYGDDGNVILREMTEEERIERQNAIETLDTAIEAKKNGSDMQITPEMFEIYLKKSDGDPNMHTKGYYFNASSVATAEFGEEFPEIVEAALSMGMYEYLKVECSIGVCYLYRYEVKTDAYTDKDNLFFSDFYSDASDYLFANVLSEMSSRVVFADSYSEIDVVTIPLVEEFYVKAWKK